MLSKRSERRSRRTRYFWNHIKFKDIKDFNFYKVYKLTNPPSQYPYWMENMVVAADSPDRKTPQPTNWLWNVLITGRRRKMCLELLIKFGLQQEKSRYISAKDTKYSQLAVTAKTSGNKSVAPAKEEQVTKPSKEKIEEEIEIWTPANLVIVLLDYYTYLLQISEDGIIAKEAEVDLTGCLDDLVRNFINVARRHVDKKEIRNEEIKNAKQDLREKMLDILHKSRTSSFDPTIREIEEPSWRENIYNTCLSILRAIGSGISAMGRLLRNLGFLINSCFSDCCAEPNQGKKKHLTSSGLTGQTLGHSKKTLVSHYGSFGSSSEYQRPVSRPMQTYPERPAYAVGGPVTWAPPTRSHH